ncbi:MAG: peptide ABC transporter substrate-binding protein [Candidatus Saccharibacteria bacterium]
MSEDNSEKKSWIPKIDFDKRKLTKKMRKVEGATVRHTHKFIIKRLGNIREVQKDIIVWILVVGILIAATGMQLVWFRQNYRVLTSATNGTYAEAVQGPVKVLNPLFADSSAEQAASYLMFSRLLNYDKTGHLSYDLASSVTTNAEKTIYTVKVRDDVKWHDGNKLTAEDINFTIGIIKSPNIRTGMKGWTDIGVRLVDEYTIEFSLSSAYADFEHMLVFPVLPKHILGDIAPSGIRENNFSNNPIGSGPFKFSFTQEIDKTTGRKIIYLVKNQHYYKGLAKIDRFQLNVYATTDEIFRAISTGEVNAAADLQSTDIKNIDKNRYDVESNPVNSGVYAILNTRSALLQDINLRRSLQLATNTEAIRSELPDTTPALDLPFTNSQLFGDLPVAQSYNIDSAIKILNDAGWVLNDQGVREKAGVQLKLSVVTIKNSEFERVLEMLTGQWRLLGIVVETKVVDPEDIAQAFSQSILQPRNYDVLLYQLNIGKDPDVYAYWHSSQIVSPGVNLSNYSNPISDDALSSARVRFDTTLRNAKYITFAKQWLNDVPAIGLYQSTDQYVRSKNVSSVSDENILISSVDRYSNILDWSVGTKSVYKTP